ncbi:hypothetical protein, partial [Micromonospora rubida]
SRTTSTDPKTIFEGETVPHIDDRPRSHGRRYLATVACQGELRFALMAMISVRSAGYGPIGWRSCWRRAVIKNAKWAKFANERKLTDMM